LPPRGLREGEKNEKGFILCTVKGNDRLTTNLQGTFTVLLFQEAFKSAPIGHLQDKNEMQSIYCATNCFSTSAYRM